MFSKIFLLLSIVLLEIYTLQKPHSSEISIFSDLWYFEICRKRPKTLPGLAAMRCDGHVSCMMTFFGTRFIGSYSSDSHQIWYTFLSYEYPGIFLLFFRNSSAFSFYSVFIDFMGLRKISRTRCTRWVHFLCWITFKFDTQLRNYLEWTFLKNFLVKY